MSAQTTLPLCTTSLDIPDDNDVVVQAMDIDKNNNGLIEICDLEGLHAMRYRLNGSGYQENADATVIMNGCAPGGCKGYELTRSLDFSDDDSYRTTANKVIWTSGNGWQPIGNFANSFNAVFEGNGYTISNLMINVVNNTETGLFGNTASGARITSIGLLNVNILGFQFMGSLVGDNGGTIINSYATGTIKNEREEAVSVHVGGLAGFNNGIISYSYAAVDVEDNVDRFNNVGGLAGFNNGIISYSYAAGSVTAENGSIGGLVGENGGTIINSYATGDVKETPGNPFNNVGGLVGRNALDSYITNSYAAGNTEGIFRSDVGGLVGENEFGTISGSYWLKETGSMLVAIDNYNGGPPLEYVAGQTAEDLKSPTTATGIYSSWNFRVWDFGTSGQLPVLKGMDGSTLLPGQGVGLRNLEVLAGNMKLVLDPVLTDSERYYTVGIPSGIENVNLRLRSYNTTATIKVVKQGEVSLNDYFSGKGSRGQSSPIRVDQDIETVVISVTEADGGTVSYTMYLLKERQVAISENGMIDTDNIVDEGSTITLEGVIVGGSGNYGYEWVITADEPLILSGTSTASPSFTIPGDYIKSATSTSTDIEILFTRIDNDDSSSIALSKTITIRKKNNGAPALDSGLTVSGFTLSFDRTKVSDADGIVTIDTYQWQKRDIDEGNWSDISAATTSGYTLVPSDRNKNDRLYRVRLSYTDAQGYEGIGYVIAIGFRVDVDTDDDGLIEIYYLEHLDAIRYDLGGTHYTATSGAVGINQGCKADGCSGYELLRSLDFNDDTSYASTSNKTLWTQTGAESGWQPIGDFSNTFNATFEGNDYTISNLIINRNIVYVGLFGYTGSNSTITSVGLLDIDISGVSVVGGLAGRNNGSIVGSYAIGSVVGTAERVNNLSMGGLVGWNAGSIIGSHAMGNVEGTGDVGISIGGLVGVDGLSSGSITNSYAAGSVTGIGLAASGDYVGGLIGLLRGGEGITNSYATGDVEVRGAINAGSLAGFANNAITNSYATGSVTGTESANIGGLIGSVSNQDLISYSYWLKEADSMLSDLSTGELLSYTAGRTAEELKSPTEPGRTRTDVYYRWDTRSWDFGTADQFPALKASDGDTFLPGQRTGLRELEILTAGAGLTPAFGASTSRYVMSISPGTDSIDLRLRTYNINATVKIVTEEDPTVDYFVDKGSSGQSDPIPVDADTVLVITVAESNAHVTFYRIVLIETALPPCTTSLLNTYTDSDGVDQAMDIDKDGDGLIEICDLEGLHAMRYQPDGKGYKADADAMKITQGCPPGGCTGFELTMSLDFMGDASYRATTNKAIYTVADYNDSNDEGWQPIGNSSDAFGTKFEGNGYAISNLMINRVGTDDVGLFGYTIGAAEIANLSLLDVHIIGDNNVGSLVGDNQGTVTNSYAKGSVSGPGGVGGLVGRNGSGGFITNSYVMGDVTGSSGVGGLVGRNGSGGSITNSYVMGDVTGSSGVGGLVGSNQGTIRYSYSLKETGSSLNSIGSGLQLSYEARRTAAMLKSPTEPGTTQTDVYYGWDTRSWDFGTADQFPILKVSGSDTLLLGQGIGLRTLEISTAGAKLNPTFGASTTHYVIASKADSIVLELSAYNPDATIKIVTEADPSVDYFDGEGGSGRSTPITINGRSVLVITVSESNARMTSYRIVLIRTPLPPCTAFFLDTYIDSDGVDQVMDIDKDGNGLIEICDLEGLHSMRYQPDGKGYKASADAMIITSGCPSGGCTGFELTMSLDFMGDASYRATTNKAIYTVADYNDSNDEGWQPIGSSSNTFGTKFEGNGYTISNLMINRVGTDNVGLFGYTGSGAQIVRLGLLNVNIKGASLVGSLVGYNQGTVMDGYATGSVSGNNQVGGLIGSNTGSNGRITNSYATGSVSGNNNIGGLIGSNIRGSSITRSHATGSVSGNNQVGGLLGLNTLPDSRITNSYATGSVSGASWVGGLVGWNHLFSSIQTSYATGAVSGSGSNVGGLAGRNQATISYSYWLSGSASRGGTGVATNTQKTAEALKSPMTNTGIYSNWNSSVWDFGTSDQFPALKALSGTLLPGQGMKLDESLGAGLRESIRELEVLTPNTSLSPTFGVSTTHYVITFFTTGAPIDIVLRLRAYDPDAEIKIVKEEDPTVNYFAGRGRSGESDPITIDGSTVIGITVGAANAGNASYRIVSEQMTLPPCTESLGFPDDNDGPEALDIDKNGNGLIEICDLEGLHAMRYQTDGTGYKTSADVSAITVGCPAVGCMGYELTRSLDFMVDDSYRATSNRVIYTVADYNDSDDQGWEPIGSSSDTFKTIFNGNGYTISNLMINRLGSDGVGLFGYIGNNAEIANLGLLNVNTRGASQVGGLVGENRGLITTNYATGTISGNNNIGGLAGRNTGSNSHITTSYATGNVTGSGNTQGGLVGWNTSDGSIANGYATGNVTGSGNTQGSLVGRNDSGSSITRSYATGNVVGSSAVGGLVGNNQGTIRYSYWRKETGSGLNSIGVDPQLSYEAGQTAAALKSPTVATGIYSNWSTSVWDFGTSDQFPILKASDGNLLPNQGMKLEGGLRELKVLTPISELRPIFGVSTTHYVITVISITGTTSNIVLRLTAYNPKAEIAITKQGETTNYFAGKRSGEESDDIIVGEGTLLTITAGDGIAPYRITLRLSEGIKIRAAVRVFLEGSLR